MENLNKLYEEYLKKRDEKQEFKYKMETDLWWDSYLKYYEFLSKDFYEYILKGLTFKLDEDSYGILKVKTNTKVKELIEDFVDFYNIGNTSYENNILTIKFINTGAYDYFKHLKNDLYRELQRAEYFIKTKEEQTESFNRFTTNSPELTIKKKKIKKEKEMKEDSAVDKYYEFINELYSNLNSVENSIKESKKLYNFVDKRHYGQNFFSQCIFNNICMNLFLCSSANYTTAKEYINQFLDFYNLKNILFNNDCINLRFNSNEIDKLKNACLMELERLDYFLEDVKVKKLK